MTHENITHSDEYQRDDNQRLYMAKMEAELAFYRERYEVACDDLRSICERVEKGERVYFQRRSGEKIEMVRKP